MLVLGVDPDLHCTGLAIADLERVYWVGVAKIDDKLKGEAAVIAMSHELAIMNLSLHDRHVDGRDALVVEGQELYLGGNQPKGKPEDMFNLACVAGAAIGAFATKPSARPLPKTWKGQVPKQVHQARTAKHYSWVYQEHGSNPKTGYIVPAPCHQEQISGASSLLTSEWHAVMDAIGLALWGAKQFK